METYSELLRFGNVQPQGQEVVLQPTEETWRRINQVEGVWGAIIDAGLFAGLGRPSRDYPVIRFPRPDGR